MFGDLVWRGWSGPQAVLVANRLWHDLPKGNDDQGCGNEGCSPIPQFSHQDRHIGVHHHIPQEHRAQQQVPILHQLQDGTTELNGEQFSQQGNQTFPQVLLQ